MGLLKPDQKGDKGQTARQLALLAAIPAILVVAPLVGFFIGDWMDGKTKTAPLLTILGLILGFVAAAKEIMVLIKRGTSSDKKNGQGN